MADDEPDESVLSHGIREFASALPFSFAWQRAGLGKEDEAGLGLQEAPGLGLQDAQGLGWYDEHGLAEVEPPIMSMRSTGLHPYNKERIKYGETKNLIWC